ncbi:MAG TPA: Hsp70 family protein, partial [Acidimicrobiales bacterium]|nr:Hsp70 family protein [Acidimicrobiales bacterium]
TLGNRTASVPSVVFLRDDGEILVGEAATRRATSEPGRVGREFKRRVGDPTPIILGGTPYAAEMLMARLLRWSVDRVQEQQGAPPEALALTHPANWGPYKLDLLRQAIRQVDVDVALTLPEPVAAATFYASQRSLEPGAVVAVYDLGGGTFDAAMVRRKPVGFELIGTPEGIERLGGIDFDEAVFAHVRGALGDTMEELDPDEPASVAAMARLRQECIDAKEALSSDTDVSIPVLLPHLQTEVRLTRREFEDMIRPPISETIVALRRSIRSANVGNDEISAVLLVGGSSRIPLVAQMVAAELGRPIAIDAHPKDAISFGAAIAVAQEKGGKVAPESVTTVLPDDRRPPPPTMAHGTTRPAPPTNPPVARPAPPPTVPITDPRPAPPAARPAPPAGAPTPAAPNRPAPATTPQQPPAAPSPNGPGVARPAAAASGPPTARTGYQPPTAPGNGAPTPSNAPTAPISPPSRPATNPGPGTTGAGSGSYRQPPPGTTTPGATRPATTAPGTSGPAGTPGAPSAPGTPGPGTAGSGSGTYRQPPPATGAPGTPGTQGPAVAGGATAYRQPPPAGATPPARPAPTPPGASPLGGMPAAGYRGQGAAPPANRGPFSAGGAPPGGIPSGGYGAQGSGGYGTPGPSGGVVSTGDRTPLFIAAGVVAAILIVVLAILLANGGDDDPTTTTGSTGSGSTAAGAGYTEEIRSSFVSACTAQDAPESQCQCVFEQIKANVPIDDFTAYDEQLGNDPGAARPPWLDDAISACQ